MSSNERIIAVFWSIASITILISALVLPVANADPFSTPRVPVNAPLVVQYEVCANVNAPATTVAVQEYALCVQAVKSTWQDERNWK